MRLFVVAVLALACAKPPKPAPPPKPVGPPRREVGPLVALGFTADRVGHGDAPVQPDGDPDYTFRVRISGDVRAFVLFASDATGVAHGDEVWDTMTAPEKFPVAWHLPYTDAKLSWALAVIDSKGALLNPSVTLPETTFADETLLLHAGDAGHSRFVAGRTYTLFVVRTDGSVDRATTTIL